MVWRWSKTAATNASADSTINWAEGMAPSAVNDSARAEMARVAQWRDDISGGIVTTGTSTAYAVSSNQVFDTLAHLDGAMVAFTPHATSTGTMTLNVDSLGAKPLRGAPSVELPSGSLILGTPYVALYNNTDAVWYLQGGTNNPYNVPLGGGFDYYGASAPNSAFAFPTGQAISRTTYATLFSLLGTNFGAGDGSTTFNLPDKRGRVSAMYDGGSGTILAGAPWSSVGSQGHTIAQGELPAVAIGVSVSGTLSASVSSTSANVVVASGLVTSGTSPGGGAILNSGSSITSIGSTGTASGSMTGATSNLGSSTAMSITQPTLICNYIIRII